ncbi:RAD55 family ATPase [Halorarum salinum]|uniref:Recombinase RecA n=1 Tax=Halorarum salinum TaxID=2743089 RepID=A0A7D5LAH2_9EURY|nr:recombinase RecA [Halobaculum salinum]QLG62072.1 recombinase RecA [Halobaculum salinum]
MYEVTAFEESIEPGSNVLVSGPPLSGKRDLALDVLAEGTDAGEGAIVVTTKDGADRLLEQFARRTGYEGKPVAVVDTVTRQQGVGDVLEDDRVKYTSSPVDLTGIGIKLSEFLEQFHEVRGIERNRVAVHSLSTLLMYADLQTVFRFLHVFTGRIQSVDGLGIYCIDSTAHDDRTMNTLKQLFDGVVETGDGSELAVRLADA